MNPKSVSALRHAAPSFPAERGNLAELPLGQLSDATLVAALIQGSERAASAIWHRHAATVRRTLARTLGPDQDLDDLLQEVFIGFVKSASKLEDPSHLRSYLVSIAFRLAAMEIRRRKVRRWVTLTSNGDVPESPTLEREPDEARALGALYRILDRLSARDRLIFVARFIEGMQIDETAEALAVSKATVWRSGKAALARVVAEAQATPALAAYVRRSLAGASS
jgi:RNA polymerase sigma-70 factor, ECF subfamily